MIPPPSTYMPHVPGRGSVGSTVIRTNDNDPRKGNPKVKTAAAPALSDKQKLDLLRASGYRLDKGWGPVAQRAWANYMLAKQKGLDVNKAGSYWTANQKSNTRTTQAGGGGDVSVTSDAATEHGPMGALGQQFETLLQTAMQRLINPSQFAVQAAGAEFDSPINALARQIKLQQLQGKQNVHDISNWYKQANQTRELGQQANIRAANQAQTGLNDTTAAIASALGSSPAAGMVGAWGQTLAAGLQGDANAQKGFDNSFEGILNAQAAAAKQNETNYMAKLANELQGQRTDLIKQKGATRSKYLAEAEAQRFQQLAAIQNMMLGANQMGLDYKIKEQQLENAKTNNLLDELKLDYARDQMAGSGVEDPSKLPMDDRLKLVRSLRDSITSWSDGKKHGMRVPNAKPETLYNRFAVELGLNTSDPKHRTFLLQVLRTLYPNVTRFPFKFAK